MKHSKGTIIGYAVAGAFLFAGWFYRIEYEYIADIFIPVGILLFAYLIFKEIK